jgi:NAD(P)-dependent dehydrogenase (short-subunit alcohol dehydrogenase family)
MGRLQGKVAIVTGAADGIGRAVVTKLTDEGAAVVGVDINAESIERNRAETGDAVTWIVADVSSDAAEHDYVAQAIEIHPRIHIAHLNAGIEGRVAPIAQLSTAEFDRVIAVNLRSVFIGLSRLMRHMQDGSGGAITITSSTGGLRGSSAMAPYSASKHGVIGLMKSAALEGGRYGIRVNTINPGATNTRMLAALRAEMPADDAKSSTKTNTPLDREADPSEIANVVAFLSSDEASFITGAIYLADGGAMAGPYVSP